MRWKKPQELRRDLFEHPVRSDRIGNFWANGQVDAMTIGENKTC